MATAIRQIRVGEALVSVISTGEGRWVVSENLRVPTGGWPATTSAFVGQTFPVPFQCIHIASGTASVLVDAMDYREFRGAYGESVPSGYDVPRLDQQLAHIGVPATQITHVIVTHAHVDHFMLVTTEENGQRVPLFPHALVIAEQADWTPEGQQVILEAFPEDERDVIVTAQRSLGELFRRNQIHLVEGDVDLAPGIRLIHAPGESPGHALVRVQSHGQTLYCLGDLFHHVLEVEHLDWVPLWADPEKTLASRRQLITAALAENALLVAAHIQGIGSLRPTETGSRWESLEPGERFISIGATSLFVVERGTGYPVIVVHGLPGIDHHEFGGYLDPLAERYRLILMDLRGHGRSQLPSLEILNWQQWAHDINALAEALGLERFAVLGHSGGAMIALQHAVDYPGAAAQTIVVCGVPSKRYFAGEEQRVAEFEPAELREQYVAATEAARTVQTQEDCRQVWHAWMPFCFANPLDSRIGTYLTQWDKTIYAPQLHHSPSYGPFDLEGQLGSVTQPVLVLAGRFDRDCVVEASEAIARSIPGAELAIFEQSGHFVFVEEPERFLAVVHGFLDRHV
jgi:proline-specific peptidase